MGIEFDALNKLIKITSPTTALTALELYTATMDWVDEQENITWSIPMRAVGKFGMGGGVYSDSIFMLTNGWKLKPWSGNYQLVISGTLITDDETPRMVPPDSGNVEAVFQVSSQGTLVVSGSGVTEQDKIDIANRVEVLTGAPIKTKTDNLPDDPTSKSNLETGHGAGSWEGATPSQVWGHSDRKLTSREIEAPVPGEHLPSEEQVQDVQAVLEAIKGLGFESAKDALKMIRQLVEAGGQARDHFET